MIPLLKHLHSSSLPSSVMMVMMMIISCSPALMYSSENKDPNLSFTYFTSMSDPNMNIYENPHGQSKAYFSKLFFRSSKNDLFLAGMDVLYQLNPENISIEMNKNVNLTDFIDFQNIQSELMSNCQKNLIRMFPIVCINMVQVIFWKSTDNSLRVCTSGLGSPKEFLIDTSTMRVLRMSSQDSSSKCSGIPYSNFTSLYVESENAIFSGTPEKLNSGWSYGKHSLDENWDITKSLTSLKRSTSFDVRYVASLEIDNFIYVFLHEIPYEETIFGVEEMFHTRVARICKNDPGNIVYPERTITYIKLRVRCKDSTGYDDIFYQVVTDVSYNNETKQFNLLVSTLKQDRTAVCVLDRSSIDSKIESSKLLGQDENKFWIPIDRNFPDVPRPPSCTVRQDMKIGEFSYYGLYELSSSDIDGSIIMGINIFFTKFVIEKTNKIYRFIYWLYTPNEPGYLTRLYAWRNQGLIGNRRISKIKLFKHKRQISKIRDLQMLEVTGIPYIFAVMENAVVQLNLEMCSGHTKCTTCVLDPYCVWLTRDRRCTSTNNANGDHISNNPEVESPLRLCLPTCLDTTKHDTFVISGSNAAISCNSDCSPDDNSYPTWYHNDRQIFSNIDDEEEGGVVEFNGNKNVRMVDGKNYNLYFFNATHEFTGKYECRDSENGLVFATANVNVTKYCKIEGDFEATWRREFNNWCVSYEEYANSFQNWKSQHCSNTECVKNCCIT